VGELEFDLCFTEAHDDNKNATQPDRLTGQVGILNNLLISNNISERIDGLNLLLNPPKNNTQLFQYFLNHHTSNSQSATAENGPYLKSLANQLAHSRGDRQKIIADQLTICECQQKIELAITRWEEKYKSASGKDRDMLNDKISTAKELLKPHASLHTFKSRFDSAKTQINKRRDSIGTTLLKVIEAILFPVAIIHSALKGTLFHRSHGEILTNELSKTIEKATAARAA
ncbi:MAG: hypothetical protein KDH94_06415, partial [Coxiellaceae bacterium]|nr:hypothetical protein [Coxiellaceae bacterium]